MSASERSAPLRIALLGASGRMGHAVIEATRTSTHVSIGAIILHTGGSGSNFQLQGVVCTQDMAQALSLADVLVDFSSAAATAAAATACSAAGKPMVSGVTGLGAAAREQLVHASRRIAILSAPNMSLGANLLIALTGIAAKALGPEFDIEITDIHHRGKRDAPSGTALAIGESAAAARGRSLAEQAVFARHGHGDVRRAGSIGFASLRAGEIAGEHRVLLAGEGETLELSHRAAGRAAFAEGALAAACWIVQQPAGMYGMAEVLGLHT